MGRLLERNTRAARLFDVQVEVDAQGFTQLRWTKVESWREWARKSEGCYLLRSKRDGVDAGRVVACLCAID